MACAGGDRAEGRVDDFFEPLTVGAPPVHLAAAGAAGECLVGAPGAGAQKCRRSARQVAWFPLRGNDLSAVNTSHNRKRVVIDRTQLMQLAEELAAELRVTFGDDPRSPMASI